MTLRARKLFVTSAVAMLIIMAAADVGAAVVFCDGGAQEAVFTNSQTDQTAVTTASGWAAVPSTTVPGGSSGVAGDSDVYTVTFSGEAGATGGGSWQIQVQASVNGGAFVNIDPVGANVFHTGDPRHTHTMTWCKRIEATTSVNFMVVWRKIGGGTAILDDYLIQVQRSN